jgi:hypothetical protein
MIQNKKQEHWLDEQGRKVPFKYVSKFDKQKESELGKILKEAEVLNNRLSLLKLAITNFCENTVKQYAEKNKIKTETWKGNLTIQNFDNSVKIELNAVARVEFDDLAIKACKGLLDEFLSENIDAKNAFISEIVTDAFSTSRGKLDTKKVLSLLKYESKIQDAKFQEAMRFLKESIRNTGSKNFYRISVKGSDNEFKAVKLDLTSL